MNSSVCTLFEGDYHFGVAALANSLHVGGFIGSLYVGYRGGLPNWCSDVKDNIGLQWDGAKTMTISDNMAIHFLPLNTNYHFTNYKPDFMLSLINGPAVNSKYLFYFDPDIVITAHWMCFEDWAECGIALSEDVNSPLAENHPRRIGWRNYFGQRGYNLRFKEGIYANGGFVGLAVKNKEFLSLWQKIQEEMAPIIGGLEKSSLKGPKIPVQARGPFSPFGKTDQDALNATVELWTGEVSFVGKEGMGFAPGQALIPHALGLPKPWKWRPILMALNGQPPRLADRAYWRAANIDLRTHSNLLVRYRRIGIVIAAFIGRFYKRGNNGGIY